MSKFLTRQEAADFLTEHGVKTARSTLAKLFCAGGGPACHHIGSRPVYSPDDLLQWAQSRMSAPRKSSSEPRRPVSADAFQARVEA